MTKTFYQQDFFEAATSDIAKRIPGLTYIPDFITEEQEQELIQVVDSNPWLGELKRRVQHYGYKYDYTARSINKDL